MRQPRWKLQSNENFKIYKNQMKFNNSYKLRQFKGKAEYLDLIETASTKIKQEAWHLELHWRADITKFLISQW